MRQPADLHCALPFVVICCSLDQIVAEVIVVGSMHLICRWNSIQDNVNV